MSDTIPAIFYFDFSFGDESSITYGFTGNLEKYKIKHIYEFMEDVEQIRIDLEEKFGVHDWSSSPDYRVMCFGGYTTYEVEPEAAPQLMELWKERLALTPMLNIQYGPTVKIEYCHTDTDYDIYLKIIKAQG